MPALCEVYGHHTAGPAPHLSAPVNSTALLFGGTKAETKTKSYVASLPGDVCYAHTTVLPAEKAIPSVPL